MTVVVPTYKRSDYLAATLLSLELQLKKNFNVLVVDNDAEGTENKALLNVIEKASHSLSITLFRNTQNLGMFGNWNRGMELADTEWVTILHDDDLLAPTFTRRMEEILENDCRTKLLGASSQTFYGTQTHLPTIANAFGQQASQPANEQPIKSDKKAVKPLTPFGYFLSNPHVGTLGIVFSRTAAIDLGGFTDQFGPSSDYEFFARFCTTYRASYFLSEPLAFYRVAVNESLKPSTMKAFVENDFKIRSSLAQQMRLGRLTEGLLSTAAATAQIQSFSNFSGNKIDGKSLETELLRQLGITRLTAAIMAFLFKSIKKINFLLP